MEIEEFRNVDVRREDVMLGKFEGNYSASFARALYDIVMNGCEDDQIGDVSEYGCWYGLINLADLNIKEDGQPVVGVIVTEDSNGFFSYTTFDNEPALESEWKSITDEVGQFYEDDEDANEYT